MVLTQYYERRITIQKSCFSDRKKETEHALNIITYLMTTKVNRSTKHSLFKHTIEKNLTFFLLISTGESIHWEGMSNSIDIKRRVHHDDALYTILFNMMINGTVMAVGLEIMLL